MKQLNARHFTPDFKRDQTKRKPNDEGKQMHHFLPGSGYHSGRHRLPLVVGGDLCSIELLGLFCVFRIGAHLSEPGVVDILVYGELNGA